MHSSTLLIAIFALHCAARNAPKNIQDFYNQIRNNRQCSNIRATGFNDDATGPNDYSYCADYFNEFGVIYLQGRNKALADMDVSCNGIQSSGQDSDGRCNEANNRQGSTSFDGIVRSYGTGVVGLNPYVHTYVDFGSIAANPATETNYDPRVDGIQPLSVMAVVCGNGQMYYGVWGEYNTNLNSNQPNNNNNQNDGGPNTNVNQIGSASYALAKKCYNGKVDVNDGHDEPEVLYLAFTGQQAVPGPAGANWAAGSADEFENSLAGIGQAMISRIPFGAASSTQYAPLMMIAGLVASVFLVGW